MTIKRCGVVMLVALFIPLTALSQYAMKKQRHQKQTATDAAPTERMMVHVRSTQQEARNEVSAARSKTLLGLELAYTLYVVTSGNLTYTLESADTRQPEVGKDYEVKWATKGEMALLIPGKKKPAEVLFHIRSVAEDQKDK